MSDESENSTLLKIVVIVVNAEKKQIVTDFLQSEQLPIIYQFHAYDTVTSKMLNLFGFDGVEKTVVVSIAPDFCIEQLTGEISIEAFSIPISGIALRAMALLIDDANTSPRQDVGKEVCTMNKEIEYVLLVVAAKHGYSEEIVEVAKQAGATGGIVWDAGKIDLDDPIKVLGVTLQSEQEIIAMLVAKDKKTDIMMSVNKKFGIETEAQGLILSLPVDNVYGVE